MLITSNDQFGAQSFRLAAGRIVSVISLTVILLLSSTLLLNQPWRVQAASSNSIIDQPTASIRYVAVDGTDAGNDCATSTTPCATVQRAVDVAAPDDEIRVAAGTYTGVQVRQGITQVVYISQSVMIRGGYTTTNWMTSVPETNATILDAQGEGRVIVIPGNRVVLEGLRLTGGDTRSFTDFVWDVSGRNGGGVYIDISSQAIVNRCQIYSNTSTAGGGLFARYSVITVTQNRVFSNSATSGASWGGGGLYVLSGRPVIENNRVFGNNAEYGGGVLLGLDTTGGRLSENQIYNNQALKYGGGLALDSPQTPDVLISRNVFSQNVAGMDGGGMILGSGISMVTDNLIIDNAASREGGGAFLFQSFDTLAQNTFISNTSGTYGGGVSILSGAPALSENHFAHNSAGVGGGVQGSGFTILTMTANTLVSNTAMVGGGLAFHAEQGDVILRANTFAENQATNIGGGIVSDFGHDVSLSRNIISGNVSPLGGGVLLSRITKGAMTNNILLNNTSYALLLDTGEVKIAHNTVVSNEGGISGAYFGAAYGVPLQLTIVDTILAKNYVALDMAGGTTATLDGVLWFDNVSDTSGSGYITVGQQITANPQLAADGYHLLTGSHAIDAGVPSGIGDDIDGEPRPSGLAVDIGADEWQYPTAVDLTVSQQISPEIVYPSQGVTYTIAYRNQGVGITATGAIISVEMPSGLTNLSVLNSGAVLTSVWGTPYIWQVADLPPDAGGSITITALVTPGFAPQVVTVTVSLTATQSDSNLADNMASTVLTIANHAPLANAGPAQVALVNESITLDGSASTDLDGHVPLTYEWQQIGGIPIILSSNTISRPMFTTPDRPSILTFSLDVTDSVGLRSLAAATTVVTVTDRPVTNFSALNDSPKTLGQPAWFTATAAGSNIIYTWNFGDGATSLGNPISHTYLAQGVYTTLVTATNGANSLSVMMPVTITNLAPVAVSGPDQTVYVNSSVDLDGSGSYDQDGHWPVAYHWLQVGGPAVVLSSEVVSRPTFFAPASPTVFTFTLQVTDAYGLASGIEAVTIQVVDQPISGLQITDNSPMRVGHTVNLTAALTAGSNVAYQWNFGDGIVSDQTIFLTMTHVYTRYGSFTAIVTAANQSGSQVAEKLIVIQPYSVYIPIMRQGF